MRARWIAVLGVAALVALAGCGSPRNVGRPAVPMTGSAPGSSTSPANPPTTTTTEPPAPVAPDRFIERRWEAEVSIPEEPSTVTMQVPEGWVETVGDKYWSDFVDATEQIRFRADVTGSFGQLPAPRAVADQRLEKVRPAKGFRLIEDRELPAHPLGGTSLELIYRHQGKSEEMEVVHRLVGDPEFLTVELSVHYPVRAKDIGRAVLERAYESVALG